MANEYWENRYASEGTSGDGSIGELRAWKWKVITEFLPTLDHVIDIGCGDLSFWDDRNCKDYTGIDVSKTIIERNRKKRPEWSFINSSAEKYMNGLKKEYVFCLDVLFHIMDLETFIAILNNLCSYSTDYIFIHTWIKNPFSRRNQLKGSLYYLRKTNIRGMLTAMKIAVLHPYTDGKYQYFRSLETYMYIFENNGFELLSKKINENNGFYIFRKVKE
jgi:2-polyprenyl-3-methyl-5-hydroxy-6-metoxy-1,4-benzoquinol methylase